MPSAFAATPYTVKLMRDDLKLLKLARVVALYLRKHFRIIPSSANLKPRRLVVSSQTTSISDTAIDSASESKFKIFSAGEILANTTPPEWTIRHLIEHGTLGDIVAESGVGKTFVGLDMACSVATGISYHGHTVKHGPVVVIAGEGNRGLAKRIMSWGIHHNKDMNAMPLFISERAAQLSNVESILEVEVSIQEIVHKCGGIPPVLFIIDTLACNYGPGNESSIEDMNTFLWNIKLYIQERFQATVLIIHHTGHGNKDRGRGASNFPAAMDFHFMLDRKSQNIIQLTNKKQKDGELAPPISFEMNVIELPLLDDEGVPLTSIALSTIDTVSTRDTRGLGKNQQRLLDLLRLMCEERTSADADQEPRIEVREWKSRAEASGLVYGPYARQNFKKLKDGLQRRKLIEINEGYVNVL